MRRVEQHLFSAPKELKDDIIACVPCFAADPKILDRKLYPAASGEGASASLLDMIVRWSQEWTEHIGAPTSMPTKNNLLASITERLHLRSRSFGDTDLYWHGNAPGEDHENEKELLLHLARTIEPFRKSWQLELSTLQLVYDDESYNRKGDIISVNLTLHALAPAEVKSKHPGRNACCAGREKSGGVYVAGKRMSTRVKITLQRATAGSDAYHLTKPVIVDAPTGLDVSDAFITLHFVGEPDSTFSLRSKAKKNGQVKLEEEEQSHSGREISATYTSLFNRQMRDLERAGESVQGKKKSGKKVAALAYEMSSPQALQIVVDEFTILGTAAPSEDTKSTYAYFVGVQFEYDTSAGTLLPPPVQTRPAFAESKESEVDDGISWVCSYRKADTTALVVQIPVRRPGGGAPPAWKDSAFQLHAY